MWEQCGKNATAGNSEDRKFPEPKTLALQPQFYCFNRKPRAPKSEPTVVVSFMEDQLRTYVHNHQSIIAHHQCVSTGPNSERFWSGTTVNYHKSIER